MQIAPFWIWTQVAVSILYHDNYYTRKVSEQLEIDIFIMVRVFANGLGDLDSIRGRVIPMTQKMILDATLLDTQHYKVRIKGKVEQSRKRSSAHPYTLV